MIIVCGIIAWGLTFITCWSLWNSLDRGFKHVARLHQIPCSRCRYFTNSHYLKCTVDPQIAASESAIGCRDFLPVQDR